MFLNRKRFLDFRSHLAWQFLGVLGWILAITPLPTAASPNGAKIYRSQCAKCHGPKGEGVEDEYADPLEGDWSLEKLAHYIDKNMPDNNPKKCVGADAEAVAKYINNSFYSREARLRNHPIRIELARLTNRQYLNTVADLFKLFTGKDHPPGDERGLSATYYGSKNFNKDKKLYERVDSEVAFDFGDHGPEGATTNEFSIQWRGSLLTDETGEYQFIVKTGNGMRLWVNDGDEPLIDAWVSSGQVTEYKASLRLIGGRAYPIRLNCFRFKEKTNSISLSWLPPKGVEQIIPKRNLTPARSTETFVVETAFPADDSSIGYERGVSISKAWDEAETHGALEAAAYTVKHLEKLAGAKRSEADFAEKVERFCERFAAAAFRRPLSPEQEQTYVKEWFGKEIPVDESVKRVVLLALQSPRFLYVNLPGSEKEKNYEIAARLSYALWDSMPDEKLEKAAAAGALRTPEQARQQAERMLKDVRAHAKIRYFLQQWSEMNHVDAIAKDRKAFPKFTPELVADLRTSLNLGLDDAAWGNGSDYRELLLGKTMFVNRRIADYYGFKSASTNNDDFVKITLEDKERSGILTHPYLLAEFSYPKFSSPIHRGVFLTRNIVGRMLKPPPKAFVFKDADFSPDMTMREKVTEFTKPESCQNYHSIINSLGFTLEHFDAVGRYRAEEKGKPIDSESKYRDDDGEIVELKNARSVAEFAAGSEHARNTFIEHLFHQMTKQPILAYGAKTPDELRKEFVESEFSIQKLAVEIATRAALYEPPKASPKLARNDAKK
jgi:hypothetical protein